jgi:hypothetical protein
LVGQKKAVAIAVRNASGRRRWSKLAEWLRRAWRLRIEGDFPPPRAAWLLPVPAVALQLAQFCPERWIESTE